MLVRHFKTAEYVLEIYSQVLFAGRGFPVGALGHLTL